MNERSTSFYVRLQRLLARFYLFAFALLFASASFLLALQADVAANLRLGLAALVAATLCLAEMGRALLQAGSVRSWITARRPLTLGAQLGRINAYLIVAMAVLFVPVLLGLIGLVGIGLADRLRAWWPSLPSSFYIVLCVFLAYVIARDQIVGVITPLLRPLARHIESLTPSYELRGRSIILDLKRKRRGPSGQEPASVRIDFEELDEARVLSFSEIGPYISHQVGLDPQLAASNVEGTVGFFAGKIDRPSVYRDTAHGTRPALLLRGPEVFYLVSIANPDPGVVERAFRDFKSDSTPEGGFDA